MNKQDEVIALYSKDGWKRWFAKWRFWVAPYAYVETIVPKRGTVMELGCGEGLFSNYLALTSKNRKVIGVELDKQRVKIAQKGLKNTQFQVGNALKAKFKTVDCIVLFHVLHHLTNKKSQQSLISKISKSLSSKGKLIIVEIDQDYSPKYYITWFWDHFMVPWFFERSLYQRNIFFRDEKDWKQVFKNANLNALSKKCDDDMPFSHIVYVCTPKK